MKKNLSFALMIFLVSIHSGCLFAATAPQDPANLAVGCPEGKWTDGNVRYVGTSSNGLVRIMLGAPGSDMVYEDNKYSTSDPIGIAMLNVELVAYAMQTTASAYCQGGKIVEFVLKRNSADSQ